MVQVGIDHSSAPLAAIERLHRSLRAAPPADLRSRCDGAVRLVTCHRLELYVEGVSAPVAGELFSRWLGVSHETAAATAAHVIVRTFEVAGEHLMRVAAGLESAVLGEDQIQGQVRDAYRSACSAREPGPLLHRLFHAAFRAGRRARSETPLKQGGRSFAGSAVALIDRELGDLQGAAVLVLGAGEMARVAAVRLRERGVGRLILANRTWARAQELAAAVGGEALPWAWRERILGEVDGVVCATGAPAAVVTAESLSQARNPCGRKLVVIDLAMPRNVEVPDEVPAGLVIADIESLTRRLDEDAERRRGAIAAAQAIIAEELESWVSWARTREERAGREESTLEGSVAG